LSIVCVIDKATTKKTPAVKAMFQKGQLPGGMACARKENTPMPQYLSWDSNVIDCGGGQNIWKIYFEDAGAAVLIEGGKELPEDKSSQPIILSSEKNN
jgi:hypothetical protein